MKERIQRLIDLGVTRSTICRATGIDNSLLTKWLKGDRNLKDEKVERIAAWLEEFKKQVAEI